MISTVCSIISTVFAILAVVLAYLIPEKIKWEQLYNTLLTEYMSYDFAVANQSIIEFFYTECKKDYTKIKEKSEQHYINEVLNRKDGITPENTLHFQRRLLTDFYWLLDYCAHSKFIGEKRVSQDFTKGDCNLIKIVFWMNKATDESELLYKDISVDERIPRHKSIKGINRNLSDLCEILSKSKRYIKGKW